MKKYDDFARAINCTHKLTWVCLCMGVRLHASQGTVCRKIMLSISITTGGFPIVQGAPPCHPMIFFKTPPLLKPMTQWHVPPFKHEAPQLKNIQKFHKNIIFSIGAFKVF